jgi:hypothetical protein
MQVFCYYNIIMGGMSGNGTQRASVLTPHDYLVGEGHAGQASAGVSPHIAYCAVRVTARRLAPAKQHRPLPNRRRKAGLRL